MYSLISGKFYVAMKKIGIACLGWVMVLNAVAQTRELTAAAPEKNGFSAERLQRIDRLVKEYMDSNWIAGAIAIVAKDGHIVYHKGIGFDDASKNKPMQKGTIFRIASQTKALTSVSVMMLYEEGRLLLDDAVSKYIPAFRKPVVLDKFNAADSSYTTVPAKREITVRDLLTHTSGIGLSLIHI